MATKHLPLLEQPQGSLLADGSRAWVETADVTGRFTTLRRWVFSLLVVVFVVLPWIHIGGHPAVFFDIEHASFYLFGLTFAPQDAWLAFFIFTGIGFALVVVTTLWGRVWCGYACPQTVWLEGVYRRIERLLEGSRSERLRRAQGPLTAGGVARKVTKHALYLLVSWLIAHVFMSYFVSLPRLYGMVRANPAEHWTAFLWATGFTLAFYGNFAWFREQLCLVVCPYGRLQSVLIDKDSLVIGYDTRRGEPRGKAKEAGHGDCVDCKRCVVVCPTGIDIRNGLQLECVGCAQCVDACDEVMGKLGRAPGLIRYDSHQGFHGEKRQLLRPRLALYAVLGVVGLAVASYSFMGRTSFEANFLRVRGAPFVVEGGEVRNAFELHLVNKASASRTFRIEPVPDSALDYTVAVPEVTVGSLADVRVPVFVTYARGRAPASRKATVEVVVAGDGEERATRSLPLLGPP